MFLFVTFSIVTFTFQEVEPHNVPHIECLRKTFFFLFKANDLSLRFELIYQVFTNKG